MHGFAYVGIRRVMHKGHEQPWPIPQPCSNMKAALSDALNLTIKPLASPCTSTLSGEYVSSNYRRCPSLVLISGAHLWCSSLVLISGAHLWCSPLVLVSGARLCSCTRSLCTRPKPAGLRNSHAYFYSCHDTYGLNTASTSGMQLER